ncbi:MAG: hypothetical protein JWP63_2779 [Candidatus Solibacter sp.]|nr:hypothetical protein [Candidatus Solibacter sp.]
MTLQKSARRPRSERVAMSTVVWAALVGNITVAIPSYAQSPPAQPAASGQAAADPWGQVQTDHASLANLAPLLLPYFNNGPVFGLPGTDAGDFWHRTQLSGDWGGVRTDLARHGLFFDIYSTSAYQDVASGGLTSGGAFVQNTQLSINVDTGRAGLWAGGLIHVTLESRDGSSPQSTFTVGSTAPQYTGLAIPGPLFTNDVLPTEYYLLQSLTPKVSVLLGKNDILTLCDQTLFGNSYKDYFANFNFNKNPMALNFFNTTSLGALGVWTPTNRVTIVGGVLDPNSQADNLATHAFDRVNIYGTSIFSYTVAGLPGLSAAEFNWTNKPKIDLASPFGRLSAGEIPQAVAVLAGGPSTAALPVTYKPDSWATIGNISQYLYLREDSAAIAQKLKTGQPLRGIGLFGRVGYAPEETNRIARDASIALFARGLFDFRPNDSLGVGFYYNGISGPLKKQIAQLTGDGVTVKDEKGVEIFYDLAITPALRFIPSYQHIWNPLTAAVARNERRADVFLLRFSLTF